MPHKAMRGLGVSSETLPFDWIRISMHGLVAELESDFASFLAYSYSIDGPHSKHFVKEGSHSFFHDDLDDNAAAQDAYLINTCYRLSKRILKGPPGIIFLEQRCR